MEIKDNPLRSCFQRGRLLSEIEHLLTDWCLLVSQGNEQEAGLLLRTIRKSLRESKSPKKTAQEINGFLTSKALIRKIIKKEISKGVNDRFSRFSSWIDGDIILDFGAGRGEIAERIYSQLSKHVCLVDVVDHSTVSLPIVLYDGRNLPYADNKFNTSIASLVLHHCSNPEPMFNELLRVTKKRLIIQETVYEDAREPSLAAAQFFDWFVNWAMLGKFNMPIPFQFRTPARWRKYFRKNGLITIHDQELGRDMGIAPEYHWLFVVDKPEKKHSRNGNNAPRA